VAEIARVGVVVGVTVWATVRVGVGVALRDGVAVARSGAPAQPLAQSSRSSKTPLAQPAA
jgi:hypothetical protein